MTTAISAVLDPPGVAATAPATPNAPMGGEGGHGFEVALAQALKSVPTTTTSTDPASAPQLSDPVLSTAPDTVSVPSEAIAAFLAVFLAMAGQMLGGQPVQGEPPVQGAAAVGGSASSADEPKRLLDALQKLAEKTTDNHDTLQGLFESVVAAAGTEPTQSNSKAGDRLAELVQLVAGQTGVDQARSFIDGSPGNAGETGVRRLDGLAAKAANVGEALTQIAATAASMARELAAATGSVTTSLAQPALAPAEAKGVELVQRLESARALVKLAELGHDLRLGEVKGKSEITVQLQPGSLGKLHVQLERASDGVTARIEATTVAGQRAVEASLDQIRGALQAAGVAVDTVEVSGPAARTKVEVAGPAPETKVEGAKPVETANADPVQKAPPADGPDDDSTTARTNTDRTTRTTDTSATLTTPPPAATVPTHITRVEVPHAPVPSATPEAIRLVRDLADQLGVLAGQGKSEFQLQLRPESLGRLHMRLTVDDGNVTVRMQAENVQVKGMIESNLGQLKQSLHDQGLRVDRFVVEVAQGQFSQDSQHPRRSRGWVDDVRPNRGGRGDGAFAEELAAAGAQPVDYRA